jgi:hypothetical protein
MEKNKQIKNYKKNRKQLRRTEPKTKNIKRKREKVKIGHWPDGEKRKGDRKKKYKK